VGSSKVIKLNERKRQAVDTNTIRIDTWDTFFNTVKGIRDSLQGAVVWYRGHIDARYALTPSLFRMGLKPDLSDLVEKNAFELFQRRVDRLRPGSAAQKDWHVLADMQHYGVPTRLLDWTSVLGIAVFFATARYGIAQDPSDFAIYILDPVALNKAVGRPAIYSSEDEHFGYQSIYWHHRPFVPPGAIALETPFVNDRVYAQQGLFTVHVDGEPLENARPDAVRKVVLSPSCAEGAREFLSYSNLNDATVFPDMEGLVRYVRTQMFALSAH
jgi:hypothetical protein